MKYKVTTVHRFTSESDANTFMNQAKSSLAKAVSINEDKENVELSYCEIEKCYHDQVPTLPCEIIERFEIRNGAVKSVDLSRSNLQ